ncbi:MAG: hypothetical protein AAF533_11610 [Acidobacteriota bacterium]
MKNAEAQVQPTHEDFESGLAGWGPCPAFPNVTVTLETPGPSGDADDDFVQTVDLPNASSLCAGPAFLGDWTEIAASGCGRFCYDFQLILDNSGRPEEGSSFVLTSDDGPGGNPTLEAVHRTDLRFTVDSGWARICAPITLLQDGELPASDEGEWSMLTGTDADWDQLLANVTQIRFGTDYPGIGETQGFDNVRIDRGDCTSHDFDGLAAGTAVTIQFPGISVSGSAPVLSFDTSATTCGDDDLATPGTGPGNDTPLFDVLILSEGLHCVPDDDADGGLMRFEYDEPAEVGWIGLLDIEEDGGSIRLLDAQGGLITSVAIPAQLADNGWQRIDLNQCGVKVIEVELIGSGAVTDLACTLEARRSRVDDLRGGLRDRIRRTDVLDRRGLRR